MLPGVVGLIQATEAIKQVVGTGKSLVGRLVLYDALKMSFKDVKIRKDTACELCGDNPSITELIDYEAFCAIPLPSSKPDSEVNDESFDESQYTIEAPELEEIIEEDGDSIVLVDVREQNEWDICYIENSQLMPLSTFDEHIEKLNPKDDIYLYCYKGTRSMNALKKLHKKGFRKLKSLSGGIDRWAEIVDPSMPRY